MMNRTEFKQALLEELSTDPVFRHTLINILCEDLPAVFQIKTSSSDNDHAAITDVELNITSIPERATKDALNDLFRPVLNQGFASFMQAFPHSRRKKEKSCRLLYMTIMRKLIEDNALKTTESLEQSTKNIVSYAQQHIRRSNEENSHQLLTYLFENGITAPFVAQGINDDSN